MTQKEKTMSDDLCVLCKHHLVCHNKEGINKNHNFACSVANCICGRFMREPEPAKI